MQPDSSEDVDVNAAEDELDSHELDVLRKAGIVPPAPRKARRKARSTSMKGKHVLFAEDEAEGGPYRAPV